MSSVYQQSIYLTLIFIILNISLSHDQHLGGLKCGHDNLEHTIQRNINVKPKDNPPSTTDLESTNIDDIISRITPNTANKRNLNAINPANNNEWDYIRIAYDTDGLFHGWTDKTFASWFVKDVIPAAVDFLQKAVQVRPIDGNLLLERKCNSWVSKDTNKCSHISGAYNSCGGYTTIDDEYFDEIYDCDHDGNNCDKIEGGSGSPHDLLLYFTGKASGSCTNVYGFSSYCHSNLYDRPIVGFVNLCEQTLLKEGKYFTWEKAVTLALHETFHVMGFSSTGFGYYRRNDAERTPRSPRIGGDDGNGNYYNTNFGLIEHGHHGNRFNYGNDTIQEHYIPGRSKVAIFITLPTVVAVARAYYNCSNMIGIELEDFGGADTASSHWEQRILSMEFMIGYISSAAPISIFSFATFEDSGWYKMNWDYASIPPYGKQFGCEWYEDKCILDDPLDGISKPIDEDMYCTETQKYACSHDYVGKSNCELMKYTEGLPSEYQYFGSTGHSEIAGVLGYADFCPMFYHYSNGDCRIPESSHLYDSFGAEICPGCKCNELYKTDNTKNYAICYETKCAQNYLLFDEITEEKPIDFTDIKTYNNYNEYTAIRIKVSNEKYKRYEWITCWYDQSNEYKDLSYYSYKLKCPVFTDVCYNKNPWICNGHGQINTFYNTTNDRCFCNPGYTGCDCSIRDTKSNKHNSHLLDATCFIEEDPFVGQEPTPKEYGSVDNVGFINVTIKIDDSYQFSNVLRNLRLWVAIDTKIHEDHAWIQSYKQLDKNDNIYSISIGFFDDQNMNNIEPNELIKIFDNYLFKNGDFELYDIYNIKAPVSKATSIINNIYIIILLQLSLCLYLSVF